MGFSNVGLGIAHSMAHTLGAVYDTPHGVACAMMLPIVMEYNQDCTGEKYREIARAMGVQGVDSMTIVRLGEELGKPACHGCTGCGFHDPGRIPEGGHRCCQKALC